MATFVNASNVRAYIQVNQGAGLSSSQWTDAIIGSNINAASSYLQRRTGRLFEPWSGTKKFSTHGRSFLTIPDLRATTGTVTLNGGDATADQSYYLIPDRNQSGVYVGIEFPSARNRYGGLNTFDYNYRHLSYGGFEPLPYNLVIPGNWGHIPLPDELLQATTVLAAWYTLRPDALLANARQTPEGNVFDLSGLPVEVTEFIRSWEIHADHAVSV